MATGEGKTLVASLPSYLNALRGNGVHVVTVSPGPFPTPLLRPHLPYPTGPRADAQP